MRLYFDKFLSTLFILVISLIIIGGGVVRLSIIKIEIGSLDAWSISLLFFSLLFYKIYKSAPSFYIRFNDFITKSNRQTYIRFVIFMGISIFISHIFKYLSFQTDGADEAFVVPAILNFLSYPILACDVCNHASYMGEHTSPILMLIGPLLNLIPSHITLYALEVIIVLFSIHLLISSVLKDKQKFWFIAFLIIFSNRSLRQSLIWDFREDHLSFLSLSIGLWALYTKRLFIFVTAFIATLISKEHLAYFLPFMSFPIILEKDLPLTKKQRIFLSIFITSSSVGWLTINSKIIVPYFNGGQPPTNHIVGRFPGYGSTNSEVVKNILFGPEYWLKLLSERVLSKGGIKYTILFCAPYILLLFKRWWWIIAILPLFAMNLLSYAGTQRMMIFHYDLPILPILIFSMLLTIKKMNSRKLLYIPLIVALCFSGRWPNYQTIRFLPSIDNIKDRSFFINLNSDERYATSMRISSNITTHKSFRVFRKTNYNSFKSFMTANSSLETKAPAYNLNNIDGIIFDTSKSNQKKLYNFALKENWQLVKESSSKRFVLIKEIK